jgi:hypothetical protein
MHNLSLQATRQTARAMTHAPGLRLNSQFEISLANKEIPIRPKINLGYIRGCNAFVNAAISAQGAIRSATK